jgi:hypothetical protein
VGEPVRPVACVPALTTRSGSEENPGHGSRRRACSPQRQSHDQVVRPLPRSCS